MGGACCQRRKTRFFRAKFAACSLIPDPSLYTFRLYYCKALFFWLWSLSAICTFLCTGCSASSCAQACRSQVCHSVDRSHPGPHRPMHPVDRHQRSGVAVGDGCAIWKNRQCISPNGQKHSGHRVGPPLGHLH